MFGFLRNLGALSNVPADLRAQLEAEGALLIAAKVGIVRHFSGHVPGVFSSTGVARYTGAFAFSRTRIVATFPTGRDPNLRSIDCGWDSTPGPAKATITGTGLTIDIDLRRVDPAFSGTMSLRYKHAIGDSVLTQLPATELTYPLDSTFVYLAAGVLPRT